MLGEKKALQGVQIDWNLLKKVTKSVPTILPLSLHLPIPLSSFLKYLMCYEKTKRLFVANNPPQEFF